MTELSIIIPVFNREKTIEKCLGSIIASLENEAGFEAEILLVDDGSEDSSVSICKGFAEKHGFITLIENNHGGVSAARNAGLAAAKGEYICFFDSDDYAGGDYIPQIRAALESKPELALFNRHFILAPKGDFTIAATDMHEGVKQDIGVIYPSLVLQKLNPCWDKLYKASIIRDNNIRFDEDMQISEDFKFTLDYAKCCATADIHPQLDYYFCFEVLGARKINRSNVSDAIEAHRACTEFIEQKGVEIERELITGRFLQLMCEFLIRLCAQGDLDDETINGFCASPLYGEICKTNFKKPKSRVEKIIIAKKLFRTGRIYLKAVRAAEKALNRIN